MTELAEHGTWEGTRDETARPSGELKGHRLRVTIPEDFRNPDMSFAELLAPVHRRARERSVMEEDIAALVEEERRRREPAPGGTAQPTK